MLGVSMSPLHHLLGVCMCLACSPPALILKQLANFRRRVKEFDVVDSILVRLRPKRSFMLAEPDLLK